MSNNKTTHRITKSIPTVCGWVACMEREQALPRWLTTALTREILCRRNDVDRGSTHCSGSKARRRSKFICFFSLYRYLTFQWQLQGRHLRGTGGPSPPKGKRKKKEKKEKRRKKEKEEKKKKKERKELWITSNYYIIKCCFFIFQFFNSPVALKNNKKCWPQRKSWNDAPGQLVYSQSDPNIILCSLFDFAGAAAVYIRAIVRMYQVAPQTKQIQLCHTEWKWRHDFWSFFFLNSQPNSSSRKHLHTAALLIPCCRMSF